MFYHIDALRKGGLFYHCWLADSWPHQFAKINQRQLWSLNVPNLVDDLIEIVQTEARNPTRRFSLRLSSQLMRGCCRIHHKQASALYGEVCGINFAIIRRMQILREEALDKKVVKKRPKAIAENKENINPKDVVEKEPQNLDYLVDPSTITLREETIITLPAPNDGFGEENEEQIMANLLATRHLPQQMPHGITILDQQIITGDPFGLTLPGMLQGTMMDGSSLITSKAIARETSTTANMTNLTERDKQPEIEIDQQINLGPPSAFPHFFPEVLIIPPPDEILVERQVVPPPPADVVPELQVADIAPAKRRRYRRKRSVPEQNEVQRKRRRLIIDKEMKLDTEYMKSRHVRDIDLRCPNSRADSMTNTVMEFPPWQELMRRPAMVGYFNRVIIAAKLTKKFTKFLAPNRGEKDYTAEEMIIPLAEAEIMRHVRTTDKHAGSFIGANISSKLLGSFIAPNDESRQQAMELTLQPADLHHQITTIDQTRISSGVGEMPRISESELQNATMPTQIISQEVPREKRTGSQRKTKSSLMAFTLNVQEQTIIKLTQDDRPTDDAAMEKVPPMDIPQVAALPADPAIFEDPAVVLPGPSTEQIEPVEKTPPREEPINGCNGKNRLSITDPNETPLGSLDRTLVSLGDPSPLTPGRLFLRKEWGPRGLVDKITRARAAGISPIDIRSLVTFYRSKLYTEQDPAVRDREIATAAFTSVLKLRQNSLIFVEKVPDSCEIAHIKINKKRFLELFQQTT